MVAPLYYPNNQNTILQADKRGDYQNTIYYGPDDDVQIGPNDLRIGLMTQVPFNTTIKRHEIDDFIGGVPQYPWVFSGLGSHAPGSDSDIELRSGPATGVTMSLPGVRYVVGSGALPYFYLTCEDALNQHIEIGLASSSGAYLRFSVDEGGSQGYWACQTSDGTNTQTYGTAVPRDGTRRYFVIDGRSSGLAKFAISEPGGELVTRATYGNPLPSLALQPYISISTTQSVTKRVLVDLFHGIRNR